MAPDDREPTENAENSSNADDVAEPRGPSGPRGVFGSPRDYLELSKPGITLMCLIMAAGGIAVAEVMKPAGSERDWLQLGLGLIGATMSVAGANTLNMFAERDGDLLMRRTKMRPLPQGRMAPWVALMFGLAMSAGSLVLLAMYVNWMSTLLAALAIASYVLVYTPLKRVTPQALAIGAVPGAMPPLLGWAISTGNIGAPGVVLFLILLVWQLPHFLAISIYRQKDYEDAGILVVPAVRGVETAKVQALWYSLLLVATSLMLVPLRVAGFLYFAVAAALGFWFFILSMRGFEPDSGNKWARSFFFASLLYLPILTLALVADLMLRS